MPCHLQIRAISSVAKALSPVLERSGDTRMERTAVSYSCGFLIYSFLLCWSMLPLILQHLGLLPWIMLDFVKGFGSIYWDDHLCVFFFNLKSITWLYFIEKYVEPFLNFKGKVSFVMVGKLLIYTCILFPTILLVLWIYVQQGYGAVFFFCYVFT